MTDVFVSYKREDEVQVGRLVKALESAGLSVWWDRALPGGEHWRDNIESALEKAKCVVVAWTRRSVSPDGSFVKEEAARAARRNVLVPVLLERKVNPPLGFGEVQAIDLTRWRGRTRDPCFRDLVSAVQAKLAGQPVPPPLGPMKRLRQRLVVASAASAMLAVASAFATNALNFQNSACGASVAAPWLSDTCGAFGLGARPKREERIAWEQRPNGDCEALRQHIRKFPEGTYRTTAMALLNAHTVVNVEQWTPVQRPLRLLIGRDAAPMATEVAARSAASERGLEKARQLCQPLGSLGGVKLRSADADPQEWTCEKASGGIVCGFEGQAICSLDELNIIERKECNAVPTR
jgi:hypothetical protein